MARLDLDDESKQELMEVKMSTKTVDIPTISLDSNVMAMMTKAVKFCASKTGLSEKRIREAVYDGDCSVCEYLRYGLAQAMAEYLGSVDDAIKSIYIYEPEYATHTDEPIPDGPGFSPAINMIVCANRKTAALSSLLNMLGTAVAAELKRFVCPKSNALCHTIEIHLVDDAEVQRRTGYGALVRSLYVRPIEIWSR